MGNWRKQYPVLRFWAGPFPMLFLYTPEATEVSEPAIHFLFNSIIMGEKKSRLDYQVLYGMVEKESKTAHWPLFKKRSLRNNQSVASCFH